MPQTLAPALPGYQPETKRLDERGRRIYLRQVREFASATRFHVATHAPSRKYGTGKLKKGLYAIFCERDATEPLPGVRLRPKGSGAEGEARSPWACQLEKCRNEKGRYGANPQALSWLRHQLWTLAAFKSRLAFWTITLPGDALDQLAGIEGGWMKFARRLHQELARRLRKAGLIVLWASVTEIQPQRSAKEKRPCPHLHIAFVGKLPGKRQTWVLAPADLDEVIAVALETAGVVIPREPDARKAYLKAAGNIQRVKKSVEEYLCKYLTKGVDSVAGWNDPAVAKGLQVRQWWNSSRALKARGKAHMPVLHGDFAWWCLGQAGALEQLGLVEVREFEAEDFRPAGVKIRAMRRDGVEIAWRFWQDLRWFGDEGDRCYVPDFINSGDWGDYPYKYGTPSLSRNKGVGACGDVIASGPSVIPTGQLESDQASVVVEDRIESPLTDVVKERLELVYRKFHIPEPIFPPARSLGVKTQFQLPLDVGSTGSSWDVGDGDSWDPYWDRPDWRGGPTG